MKESMAHSVPSRHSHHPLWHSPSSSPERRPSRCSHWVKQTCSWHSHHVAHPSQRSLSPFHVHSIKKGKRPRIPSASLSSSFLGDSTTEFFSNGGSTIMSASSKRSTANLPNFKWKVESSPTTTSTLSNPSFSVSWTSRSYLDSRCCRWSYMMAPPT